MDTTTSIRETFAERLAQIKLKQAKAQHQARLKKAVTYGRHFGADDGQKFALSNQYLIEEGMPVSPKSGAVAQEAIYIDGGISGGNFTAPFYITYGSSRPLSSNIGFYGVDKTLSLLVTAEVSRRKGKLEQAACLVEFAKYNIDWLDKTVGNNDALRAREFGDARPEFTNSLYQAIGTRALRIADACLKAERPTIAQDMYTLGVASLERSKVY
ncbi:hypothetical protein EXS73_01925 [Candidatus Pacearchaeota archaeon]|nr:hypothetical protein [Candidatus Pacearchaeota archaeon]